MAPGRIPVDADPGPAATARHRATITIRVTVTTEGRAIGRTPLSDAQRGTSLEAAGFTDDVPGPPPP
jgi:hypothetical protein